MASHPAIGGRELVRALCVRINVTYYEEHRLKDIAEQYYLNPSYLSTLFKEVTGQPFSDYLTAVRLTQARRFLLYTDIPIECISEMVGYKDRAYFSRMFSQYYGTSPGRFRRSLKYVVEDGEEYIYIAVFREDRMISAQDIIGLERFAKEKRVRAILDAPAAYDKERQLELLERAIARRPSGIMLCAVCESFLSGIERASAQGIPVVTVDSDLPHSPRLCTVGSDWRRIGILLAQNILTLLDGRGRVAILHLRDGKYTSGVALEAIEEALAGSDVGIVEIVDDCSNAAYAQCLAEDILVRHPSLSGFIALDSQGALGICAALEQSGEKDVKVVSVDASPAHLDWLNRGYIQFLVGQNRELFSYYGGTVLYDYVHRTFTAPFGAVALPERIDTGLHLVYAPGLR